MIDTSFKGLALDVALCAFAYGFALFTFALT